MNKDLPAKKNIDLIMFMTHLFTFLFHIMVKLHNGKSETVISHNDKKRLYLCESLEYYLYCITLFKMWHCTPPPLYKGIFLCGSN